MDRCEIDRLRAANTLLRRCNWQQYRLLLSLEKVIVLARRALADREDAFAATAFDEAMHRVPLAALLAPDIEEGAGFAFTGLESPSTSRAGYSAE